MTRRYPELIEEWIPHRGRMRMVERVLEIDVGRGLTEATVSDQWPTCRNGQVSAVILVDLAAQSAAAYASWERQGEERPGGRGFIVGLRGAHWSAPRIPVGTVLHTEIIKEVMMDTYATFIAKVTDGDGFTASVEIQTFRQEDPEPPVAPEKTV